jgi:hypothetical protein
MPESDTETFKREVIEHRKDIEALYEFRTEIKDGIHALAAKFDCVLENVNAIKVKLAVVFVVGAFLSNAVMAYITFKITKGG